MIAAATSRGVCLLEFTDRRMLETQLEILGRRLRLPLVPGDNAALGQLKAELAEYFAGRSARVRGAAPRHRLALPGARVAGAGADPVRRDPLLRGDREARRLAATECAPWARRTA